MIVVSVSSRSSQRGSMPAASSSRPIAAGNWVSCRVLADRFTAIRIWWPASCHALV
jgi:hypothetical protein